MAERVNKARYWWAVLYQENMREDWREVIDDVVQLPYAYCEHTRDRDSKSAHRKDHVHLILVHPNTTTYKHALNIFGLLSAEGKKAVNTCEACIDIRHCYDYLIHDTDACRKAGKEQYDPSERIEGNNFDIGGYEQLTTAQKQEMLLELVSHIAEKGYTNIIDFTADVVENWPDVYWEIVVTYNAMLERYCAGNYKKSKFKAETEALRQWKGNAEMKMINERLDVIERKAEARK